MPKAAGIPSRFPHESHLYKIFASKEWDKGRMGGRSCWWHVSGFEDVGLSMGLWIDIFFAKVSSSHVKFMNFSWTGMSKNTREPQENPVKIVGVDCSDVPPPPAESAVSRHRVLVDFLDLELVGCEISIILMKQYELSLSIYIYMHIYT